MTSCIAQALKVAALDASRKSTRFTITNNTTPPVDSNIISRLLSHYKNSQSAASMQFPQSTNEVNYNPIYQDWHGFDPSTQKWSCVDATSSHRSPLTPHATGHDTNLVLATWNIDAGEALPQLRTSAILSHLSSLAPPPDIIFLQEVSRPSLEFLSGDEGIRQAWFSSEMDSKNWDGHSFATMTLLSKARFSGRARIGPVWRVKFQSKFGRDALCCDIFLPSPNLGSTTGEGDEKRIRLVNVHLDSLGIVPSYRPHQLATVTSSLCSAERGIIAGDFNPVLPEDKTLVEENGLVDAWQELRKGDDGFTWGIDGKQAYPPIRMDKVALLGLVARDIEVMDPGTVVELGPENAAQGGAVPWSDHSGLRCTFGLA
ncbi:hypothetical protein V493_06446 [Pseudogymnoascus sp. VKM F-4281 (FW-2241)]|nr:hypothetical protein V493_06446 [Pseudogymnoascus sp. VKM F-4281 (FW-2241)]